MSRPFYDELSDGGAGGPVSGAAVEWFCTVPCSI